MTEAPPATVDASNRRLAGANGRIHFANDSRGAIHLVGDVAGVFTDANS